MIKVYDSKKISLDEILIRENTASGVEDIVSDIIRDVRKNGDAALYKYAEKFDKVSLSSLEVTKEEIDEALALVEPEFIEIIKEAAANIALYHKTFVHDTSVIGLTRSNVLTCVNLSDALPSRNG